LLKIRVYLNKCLRADVQIQKMKEEKYLEQNFFRNHFFLHFVDVLLGFCFDLMDVAYRWRHRIVRTCFGMPEQKRDCKILVRKDTFKY
jgi:hypothetical protein